MPYDYRKEIERVKKYYSEDPLQQRYSALITGESGSGKTFILRTARMPLHVDSFDPGGTKCLRDLIRNENNPEGQVIADTSWEREDPYDPDRFREWMSTIDSRLSLEYFKHFGTYCLDSATTFGDAVMNYQLEGAGRAGAAPKFTKDYTPQKVLMINYIKKLMNLPCDFIMTGHLKAIEEVLGQTKAGSDIKRIKYRFLTTGQATVIIPLQFDELYTLIGEETSSGIQRRLLTDSQGTYVARSRLRADGKLEDKEEPDIRAILKKIKIPWEDKPRLEA